MRTLVALMVLLGGCATQLTYPGLGTWGPGVQELGRITTCRGAFCPTAGMFGSLSLTTPPDAFTYQSALRNQAVLQYHVPADQIVLSDISVKVYTEVNGVVRGWKATATAGTLPPHVDQNARSQVP